MFEAWGRFVYRRRRLVLLVAAVAVVAAALWGTGVFARLQSGGGFTPPGSQSQQASDLATRAFGRDSADVVVLYRSPDLTVRDPAYRAAVTRSLAALPTGRVLSYQTYWSTGSPQFVGGGGHETYAVLRLAGATDSAQMKTYQAISGELGAPGLTTRVGGQIPLEVAINSEVKADIGRAEAISLPVLLVLLVIIFGSFAAAGLPLAIGGIGILASFAALRLLTLFTDVSIYSINITTILGLGLAIDYGLFMTARFREELGRQPTVEQAVSRTVATAGRTVAVSGVTVAVALASLMLFPETFLRSMGYGGVATVAVDMLAALTVMPALLAVLGPRVNALRIRGRRSRRGAPLAPADEVSGAWYRIARSVMRRPVLYVVVIVVALLALGSPFRSITWGGVDARALPASAEPRVVAEALASDFPVNATTPIESVIKFAGPTGSALSPAQRAALAGYVTRLDHVPGVIAGHVTAVAGQVVRVDLRYAANSQSAAARALVARVRAVPPPAGARVYVGGATAELVDELASLGHTLPWMALVVVLATFVLLFLAFGSVVLPVKAIVMNALSLTATFGAIVWIFQEGHLSGLLRFTPTGTIEPTMPILMLAIIFGLSMDYEVFLLSRVRERYDVTGDNTAAVAGGLQRTGGIITSLALLLVIVVGAFSASGITFIKLLGVGMIIALVVDATIIRVLLVPATMRLLGRANWWAPRPLRGLYARYGIREDGGLPPAPERPGLPDRVGEPA
ncbi:MAG TPA: MMPL family transporter [Streptosporangiaceae bacterium]|nr:MMPL family transporter [Streptosporangiaceae bacterium]